jgi:hypothetical protein
MLARFAAALWLLALPTIAVSSAAEPSIEYEIKAAFLFNVAKFVQWPDSAFASTDEPLIFCVIGQNPFGDSLERAFHGRTVQGRRLALRAGVEASAREDCHLAFFSGDPGDLYAEAARPASASPPRPLLTIGATEAFAEQGGMIRLGVEDGRLRFDVNEAAAAAAGLKISSQLLKLARHVER